MIPPYNFWWLSRSPLPCLHFPSKFERCPPLNSSKIFSDLPFGFLVTTDPPFFLSKIKWSPLKSSAPQAINNVWSLIYMRGFFSLRQKRGIRMRRCVHQFIRNWKFIRMQISMISFIADTRAKRYVLHAVCDSVTHLFINGKRKLV